MAHRQAGKQKHRLTETLKIYIRTKTKLYKLKSLIQKLWQYLQFSCKNLKFSDRPKEGRTDTVEYRSSFANLNIPLQSYANSPPFICKEFMFFSCQSEQFWLGGEAFRVCWSSIPIFQMDNQVDHCYVYQMVTQNVLRSDEKNWSFRIKTPRCDCF